MLEALKIILETQEFDMKMIRLMRMKRERQKELESINEIRGGLEKKVSLKEADILELKKDVKMLETEVNEVVAKIKKLESQQNAIKKVDEFNALTHEMAAADRQKTGKEHRLSDLYDNLSVEEDGLKVLKTTLEESSSESSILEKEIEESITKINQEGLVLKQKRDQLVTKAEPEVFSIYDRLLRNKKDRVVVPIENRCCSGCHIKLTAQDENLVRKGERLVFCEHCSRILYWIESQMLEGTEAAPKTRRRRRSTKAVKS